MMTMRLATVKDAEMLGKLYYECWMETLPNVIDPKDYVAITEEDAIAYFRKIKCNDTIIAYFMDEPIGFCSFGKCRDEDVMFVSGELYKLYVLQKYQHNGFGRRLVHEAVRFLRREDYSQVVVWTLTDNADTIAFYDALGFLYDGSERPVKPGSNVLEKRYFRNI